MKGNYLYGLDISLKQTGIAIYDLDKHEFVLVDSVSTQKIYATKENKELHLNAVKLKHIVDFFKKIYKEYPPNIVSIERMFSRFPAETQAIAKATGVVQVLLWKRPQYLYPPKSVKLAIWHGSATKEDVKNEILKRYPDLIMNNEDESDAVAVALTYLIDNDLIEWEKSPLPEKKKKKKKAIKEKE